MDRVFVFSSDGHGGLPRHEYRKYVEQRYLADFDDYDASLSAWEVDGRPFPEEVMEAREEVAFRTDFTDSAGRLRELESMGVACEAIFPGASPSTNPPWSDFLSVCSWRARTPRTRELQWAGERAYNRWLSDFCLDVPGRRVGLALMPFHDMDATVKEVYWAKENGLGGVVISNFNYDLPEYVHGWYWDPFFAACEEVGFALNIHGGNGLPVLGHHKAVMGIESEFFMKRPIWHLIFGGVFDRFPNLKIAVTEAQALWMPELLESLDTAWVTWKDAQGNRPLVMEDQDLPERRPSEYKSTNLFVGVSLVRLDEMQQRDRIGVETMMYGVDYPHPEGTWGQATTWRQAFLGRANVPPQEARMILGLNAVRCYNLDLAALEPVVERIGPTIEEVLAKPSEEELTALLSDASEQGFELATRHYESSSLL